MRRTRWPKCCWAPGREQEAVPKACLFFSHRWAVHGTEPAKEHRPGDADRNWGARWHYWPPHNQSGQIRCQYKKHRKKSSTTLKTEKFYFIVMKRFKRSFKLPRNFIYYFSMWFNMFANIIIEWVLRDSVVSKKCASHLFWEPTLLLVL